MNECVRCGYREDREGVWVHAAVNLCVRYGYSRYADWNEGKINVYEADIEWIANVCRQIM